MSTTAEVMMSTTEATADAGVQLCWGGWWRASRHEPWLQLCQSYTWHGTWQELYAFAPEEGGDCCVLPAGVRPDSRPSPVVELVPQR